MNGNKKPPILTFGPPEEHNANPAQSFRSKSKSQGAEFSLLSLRRVLRNLNKIKTEALISVYCASTIQTQMYYVFLINQISGKFKSKALKKNF